MRHKRWVLFDPETGTCHGGGTWRYNPKEFKFAIYYNECKATTVLNRLKCRLFDKHFIRRDGDVDLDRIKIIPIYFDIPSGSEMNAIQRLLNLVNYYR